MNSTASPRRTDSAVLFATLSVAVVPTLIATALLTVLMISFKPFAAGAVLATGGDIVNQIGFSGLGAVSLFSLLAFVDPRKVMGLFAPSFVLLILLMLVSITNATDPSAAFRAGSFTLIGILAIAAVLVLPRDADSLSAMLFTAGMIVLAMSYAGLILFPAEAIHQADAVESQHSGLWRGVFTHKNIAGPVMACFSFCGLYLYRRGQKARGALLFLLAMLFMVNTGSKTTAGLVPLAMLIVVVPGLYGARFITPVLFFIAVVGTALATLGIVFIDPLKQLAAAFFPELTYTGRVTLWEFAGEMLAQRPWTGYGYDSFWGTDFVMNTYLPFDRAWDVRPMVHGHNGYLDIAVVMGIPALCVAAWAFFVAPLRDYMAVPRQKENIYAADLFMMMLLFTALNAFLESFFFRRADPVWLFFVFGILGLRMVVRFPVVARRP